MITRELKSNSPVMTSPVSQFINEMLDSDSKITAMICDEKGINEDFLKSASKNQRLIVDIQAHDSLKERVEKLVGPEKAIGTVSEELSKKARAIYYADNNAYLMITSRHIIAAKRDEYQEGVSMIGRILAYADEVKNG